MRLNDAQHPVAPGLDARTLIVGTTGSGKSVAGADLLLRYRQENPTFPWLIFNPKHDKLLDSIGASAPSLKEDLPKRHDRLGGMMRVYHPVAESEDDDDVNRLIDQAMWLENVGFYFDEGYSVPTNSKSFRRLLTQGRSKNCPCIILSQRPVYLDKFAFTEAGFFRCFYLVDQNDRKRMKENTGIMINDDLPPYHSHWYDVKRRRSWMIAPGPSPEKIVKSFAELQPPVKRGWF